MTRIEDVRDAYLAVARANHYMVAVSTRTITDDELDEAEQLLFDRDNAADPEYAVVDLALTLIEHEKRARVLAASTAVGKR